LRDERISKGQCPNCGKEAAPYYLCYDCRFLNKITRVLRRGERAGGFRSSRRGRSKLWQIGDQEALHAIKWRPDPKPDDGRLLPRIGKVRVDVEATLIEVIRHIGRPCTLEEILAGWGRLRERRTSPLSLDLARIIAAEDKRKRRAEKRAGRA